MLKNLKTTLCLTLFFLVSSALAQDNKPADKTQPEKEKQQGLRLRACGSKEINYKATTDKKQHPTPDAPPDKALIYVLRPTIVGYKINSKLAVDGEWKGVNRGRTYFFFLLEPGEHYFCSESENQDYITLKVEVGKTYYLQQHVEAGIFKARTSISIMTEEKGKEKLKDVNLSVFEEKSK